MGADIVFRLFAAVDALRLIDDSAEGQGDMREARVDPRLLATVVSVSPSIWVCLVFLFRVSWIGWIGE